LDAKAAHIYPLNGDEAIGIRVGIDRRPKEYRRKKVCLDPALRWKKASFYLEVIVEREGLIEGISAHCEINPPYSRREQVCDGIV